MKGTNLLLTGLLLLGLSIAGCDLRRDNETNKEMGSTDRIEADERTRNVNPGSHVDPKDQVDPSKTGGGRIGDDKTVPSRNIVENATANKNLTTFISLVKNANMVNALNGTGPYTVFAPTEEAFQALPEGTLKDLMKTENRQRLEQLINNHLVAGKLTVADLQDGAMLKTTGGQQLKVSKQGNKVTLNGVEVTEADIMSSNGVLHAVNKVLMPQAAAQ